MKASPPITPTLYDGARNGRDSLLYGLYQTAKSITERTDDTKPIVHREFDEPDDQFSYLAYGKGGWVLHMLRSELGEELYRRCIKTYLERHQYGNVVTEDLNSVIEELSGRSYDRFFDQWVYHAHHPELDVTYSWDESNKLAKLSISQNQKLSESVLLFQFPLTVRFQTGAGVADRQITVKEKSEDFYFALTNAPKLVRIDPELSLLARIKFAPSEPMIDVQLGNKTDVVGRLLAVDQLSGKKDKGAVEKLEELAEGRRVLRRSGRSGSRLAHDPFGRGVRRARRLPGPTRCARAPGRPRQHHGLLPHRSVRHCIATGGSGVQSRDCRHGYPSLCRLPAARSSGAADRAAEFDFV